MAINKVKIIFVSILTILLLFLGVASFFYFGYMSEGNRAGVVLKISHRGYFCKTWEGELNLNDQGNNIKKFKFSVEDDQTKVIQDLKDVALTGERISVSYMERHKTFFWRGDTKYFITEVVRQKKSNTGIEDENTPQNSLNKDDNGGNTNQQTDETGNNQEEEPTSTESTVLSKETSL